MFSCIIDLTASLCYIRNKRSRRFGDVFDLLELTSNIFIDNRSLVIWKTITFFTLLDETIQLVMAKNEKEEVKSRESCERR